MKRAFDPVATTYPSTLTCQVVRVGPATVDCVTRDRRQLYDVQISSDLQAQVVAGSVVVVTVHRELKYVSAILGTGAQ